MEVDVHFVCDRCDARRSVVPTIFVKFKVFAVFIIVNLQIIIASESRFIGENWFIVDL